MKDLIIRLFGEYVPVTYEVTVPLSSDGSVIETYSAVASGLAGVDWEWLAGVLLFAIVLYCFLRIVGVFLKNG